MPITAVAPSEDRLQAELDLRASRLRPPAVVMQPAVMGAARLTRYSFSRTMLRRAVGDGWRARLVRFDIDGRGHGEATYEVDAGVRRFSFVAFTTAIDESEHTDRVIAERWEVTGALVEGEPSGEFLDLLRRQVPLAAIAGTLRQSLERGVAAVGIDGRVRGDTTSGVVEMRRVNGGAAAASRARLADAIDIAHRLGVGVGRIWFSRLEAAAAGFLVAEAALDEVC